MRRLLLATLLVAAGVNAHAQSTCSVSANAVSFGVYDPFGVTALDSTGNVQVACNLAGVVAVLVNYTIQLNGGGSGFSPRKMKSGTNALNYNLYTDGARTIIWGDGTAGTATVADSYMLSPTPVARNYPVYGRTVASQNAPPGAYADTITVTVNY
jgi:spore coat protein U-like protein